ncbi:MAG: TRAP transporter small permease [Synergistaceae bacterium]|nr:TRAP transporter small permease [Synergistaceae bacterium]
MNAVKKLLNNFEEFVVVPLVAVMATVIIVQVFCRYVLKESLSWSEELARYLMVWVTFVGASIGVKRGAHVGVEMLVANLPKNVQVIVKYLGLIISIIFCVVVFVASIGLIQRLIMNNQISPAMRIPMWWAYAAVPAGAFLMTVRFIQILLKTKALNKALNTEKRD